MDASRDYGYFDDDGAGRGCCRGDEETDAHCCDGGDDFEAESGRGHACGDDDQDASCGYGSDVNGKADERGGICGDNGEDANCGCHGGNIDDTDAFNGPGCDDDAVPRSTMDTAPSLDLASRLQGP